MAESVFHDSGVVGAAVPKNAQLIGLKDTSGNTQPGLVDASGNLKVAVTGAGSGGTSSVDESAFTPAVSAGTPTMGAYESSPTALTSGQLGIVALDANRNLKVNVVAGGAGGGAVTVADGADVTQGAIADSAVTGDNTGTVNAHLRGLDKILADVWDSVNHWFKVSIQNATLAVTQSGTWTVGATKSTTGTASNVADSASSVTLLASNANRLGAAFYNDSSATLYLLCTSGTASSTAFTAKLFPEGYYELPANYTGIVKGIWTSAPGGAVRVTEFT